MQCTYQSRPVYIEGFLKHAPKGQPFVQYDSSVAPYVQYTPLSLRTVPWPPLTLTSRCSARVNLSNVALRSNPHTRGLPEKVQRMQVFEIGSVTQHMAARFFVFFFFNLSLALPPAFLRLLLPPTSLSAFLMSYQSVHMPLPTSHHFCYWFDMTYHLTCSDYPEGGSSKLVWNIVKLLVNTVSYPRRL